ncbi:MAG: class I SAM-dependent methyltransferase [Acidimicrobiales bacterium]
MPTPGTPEPSPGAEHYFATDPTSASQPRLLTLHLPEGPLVLGSDRGVFAPEAVDVGTRYLLLDAPMPAANSTGTYLDLGCGYGPIAVALARRCPDARVLAVDVNRRALELCRDNAARAGVANVQVLSPEEVPASVTLDGLYANPPIRIGKAALHTMLSTWLARLNPGAKAVLVVHKHLGADSLQRWLQSQGHPSARLGSRLGYRLLQINANTSRPTPTADPTADPTAAPAPDPDRNP